MSAKQDEHGGKGKDPPQVTDAIGTSMWKPRMPQAWDDDGPDVVSAYNPFDALKKVPKFHE
jgi:hypothetical protein